MTAYETSLTNTGYQLAFYPSTLYKVLLKSFILYYHHPWIWAVKEVVLYVQQGLMIVTSGNAFLTSCSPIHFVLKFYDGEFGSAPAWEI